MVKPFTASNYAVRGGKLALPSTCELKNKNKELTFLLVCKTTKDKKKTTTTKYKTTPSVFI
jgi:hypothetical protein